jgi:pimeloyl-ACP methyl ester carboxylesterase
MADRLASQRERLRAAESAAFAHYGLQVEPRFLTLADPSLTVRVLQVGAGPATVYFHGANMAAAVWAPLLPHVPDRTAYLVELPGCGLSDPLDYADLDVVAHQRAFVGSVLDALGLERAALVGASLGGSYALRFALAQPERVTALSVLTAPAVALPGARVPAMMAFASGRIGRTLQARMPPPSGAMTRRMLAGVTGKRAVREGPDALYDALGAGMTLAAAAAASAGPAMFRGRSPHPHLAVTDDELRGCEVPVQFVWGADDVVQGPDAATRAAGLLPDARVEVLPGGHAIWFDDPARCGALLTGFLPPDADG